MKIIKLFFYCYFLILLFLFVFGVFFDFQISNSLADLQLNNYYSSNAYAVIVEVFGELPFYILISFCFVVFCVYSRHFFQQKFVKFIVALSLFLCSSFILFLAFLRTTKFAKSYIEISVDTLTFVALGIVAILLSLLFFFFINKLNKETLKKLFKFSIMIVIVSIISVFVVQIIKHNICVRARFRTIKYLGNSELFAPCWNLIGGSPIITNASLSSDTFKSFPSGHTMTATIFLCFVFLPSIFKIKNKAKYLCLILPVLFLIFVGIGRIVAGAHFLTDVVFSAFFVGLLYLVCFLIFYRKIIL